uniref:60S ribosomal protein L7a n=2 Tax=Lygus hesperus TaxID=30085 RepID=A0A146LPI9_LYGHE
MTAAASKKPTKKLSSATATKKVASTTKKRSTSAEYKNLANKLHRIYKVEKKHHIGSGLAPKRDLRRYVKWPLYIRLQRQRAVLKRRLRVPAVINQFSHTLNKNQACELLNFLSKYQTETVKEKRARLLARASAELQNEKVTTEQPHLLKYGLNHVTSLIEKKRAKLVVIAHDVDPIELVIWLPT